MKAEDAKKILDSMGGAEGMENMTKGVNEFIERGGKTLLPFMQEFQKLHMPKSKKDVSINGKNMSVSMLDDGRVIITCPTLDDAEYVYGNVKSINDENLHEKINVLISCANDREKKISILEKIVSEEKNKPWYKKLFGR